MFSTKMSHLKSSIEKKKNHLHDHSKQSSILQDHLTKSSTHKRIKLEKMISERVKPNTRRRPPSSCPIKLSTMNTTLKLGLLILCICPLLLLSDGSATNDHHNEEGSHLHPSDLIQQDHHHRQHHSHLKRQAANSDGTSMSSSSDELDHTSLDESPSGHHFEPLMSALDHSQVEASTASSGGRSGRGNRVLYACEQKQLDIECQLGESIQLIRANYGRFSIQICNEHGQLNWKVDCVSPESTKIIANSCQARQSCQLLASNDIFGDSCPGTQKYLEVHYQCIPSNRTLSSPAASVEPSVQRASKNVIQDTTSASERARQRPSPPTAPLPPAQIPGWMLGLVPPPPPPALSGPGTPGTPTRPARPASAANQPGCPEMWWRHVRWPASEPGQLARVSCPAPNGATLSLTCLAGGQWAAHVQASHCQSAWLRNLTQRTELGDSTLSILAELAQLTRLTSGPVPDPARPATSNLFGDDLAQIARLIRRLVEEMGDLLSRIGDDKQRVSFAREMVQLLIEVANNLADERQQEAWTDLAQPGRAPSERQRTSGQLVSSLESALVLFAGALNQQQQQPLNVPLDGQAASDGQDDELLTSYLKVSENVFVTIRSLPAASNLNQSVELSLPSRPSTLGTKWWASEQQFTLHLQLGAPTGAVESVMAAEPGLPQALRVVFVMIKGLGNHMEPASSPATSVNEHKQHLFVNSDLVSLSLVGAPPDQAHKSVKVDLSAPIELLFRHLDNNHDQWDLQPTWPTNRQQQQATRPPRCVYWDTTISDWLADGCKLVTSNRTHSLCACNHLTTFALLADWEPSADSLSTTTTTTTTTSSATSTAAVAAQHPYQSATSSIETTTTTSGDQQQQQQQQQPPARVQLDNIENELLLSPTSSSVDRLYLAKLLDGNLFASNQRPLVYATCLVCALLLAVQLAAGAHCRAQARRLLGSMPAEPPPPLLVANQSHQAATRRSATTTTTTTTSQLSSSVDQSPTYSTSNDDYSSALAITKNKLMSTINGDYDFAQQATGTSRKPRQQARESLVVPMKLVGQLLFLQLLVLLLVESQNYLARNLPLRQLLSLQVSNFYGEPALVDTKAQEQLNPIGWLTYLVVFGLYYLISTLTCWLLGQLLKLNGCLGRQQRKLSGHSNVVGPADKQTYLAAAAATAHQGPLINNYQQQQHHSSTSPTSSSSYQSSSSAGQGEQASSALYQHHHHLQTKQVMLPAQLASRGASTSASQLDGDLWLTRMCLSQQVQWTLTNLAPLLISAAMLYLSCCWPDSLSQQINLQTYTSSFGSQLAFWPLLVDSSWTLPMGLLLFLLPSVGVALAVCALRKLRLVWSVLAQGQHRQPAHLLGAAEGTTNSNSNMNINGRLEGQQANNPYGISGLRGTQMVAASSLNKQSMVDEGGPNWAGQPIEAQRSPADTTEIGPKQAKLVCLVLMALLACHSITWISFFAHCRQALRGQVSSSGPSQQHLMWTFAASNLLVALLLAWCSRRTLKRAASLSGLGRLAACLRATGATSGAGPAKRHYSKRDGQPVQHYGQANIKVSPSSQSLFLISSSRPQTARHAHYGGAAGYHYGANSGAAAAEASQQHLYQQLAASQHIYDSANNLNVDLQQLNAMHLAGGANNNNNRAYQMQQYEQQQQQQQAAYTLNRSLGSQLHLSAMQQQFGAHPGDLNAQHRHLTLGPKFVHTNSNGNGNTNPNGNLNHFQQSGEADGPLVALAGGQQMMMASKPAATFGPHSMMGPASHLAAHRPQQVVTEHQLFNMNAGQQQQQQQQMSSSSSSFHVASQSASSLDPSQYFNANGQPLRAAQAATNFRRANSKQHRQQQQPPMIDKIQFKLNANQTMLDDSMAKHQTNPNNNNNIYDVANYNLQ